MQEKLHEQRSADMTNTPSTFTIPTDAWSDFVAKITKLNRKAARLGCDPITYTTVAEMQVEREHTFKTEDGEYTKRYRCNARVIELRGSAPKLDGFEFVARIEYLADGASTLFHTVPGCDVKIDERFRTLDSGTCEHCNARRFRKDTFVVRNVETGAQTQVGRQCLADFTGINSPEQIAARASWLSSFSDLRDFEGGAWGRRFEQTLDALHVLTLTSAYIDLVGWTPRSACKFDGSPTSALVGRHFFIMPKGDGERAEMRTAAELAQSEKHQERAARVLTWVRGDLSDRARSDYERNLVTLCGNDVIETKHLGIVCSAVAAYQRAMNQAVEYAKRNAERAKSQHVGTVGERLRNIAGKVEFVRSSETAYGPSTLVKFMTDDGNLLTWFASGDRDLTAGQRVIVTGTVKAHKEFRDVLETQLSRCVVDVVKEVAA